MVRNRADKGVNGIGVEGEEVSINSRLGGKLIFVYFNFKVKSSRSVVRYMGFKIWVKKV